jgi:hypothetical protein
LELIDACMFFMLSYNYFHVLSVVVELFRLDCYLWFDNLYQMLVILLLLNDCRNTWKQVIFCTFSYFSRKWWANMGLHTFDSILIWSGQLMICWVFKWGDVLVEFMVVTLYVELHWRYMYGLLSISCNFGIFFVLFC